VIRRAVFALLLLALLLAVFAYGRYRTLDACAIYAQDLKRYVEEDAGGGELMGAVTKPLIEGAVAGLDVESCLRGLYRLHFTDRPFEGLRIELR
jgi:hypothetical protein